MVQQRLVQLNPDDMVRQEWCIRTTLATLAMNDPNCVKPEQVYLHPVTSLAESGSSLEQTALDLAVQIGEHLGQLAYVSNTSDTHTATWLGVTLTANGQQWSVTPLGTSLYDGLAGVGLFLAYLGEITQQHKFTALAQQTLTTLEQQRRLEPPTMLGGFSGWGGILYTYSCLGYLWQAPELWQRALGHLNTVFSLIPEDVHFDLLAGAAGGIGGALSLYSVIPEPCLLEFAHQCAHHLLNYAQPQAVGWGWPNPAGEGQALTGFAHGTAGIAWALLQLAAVTEEPLLQTKFQSAAMAAIDYERQAFDPIHLNWRDFRSTSPHTSLTAGMTAWCHGAPGIGLARLQALPYLLDPQLPQEIQIAIQTTLRNGFGFNHCLCHGDLGNLELLDQATLIWPELKESWLRQAQATLQQMQTQGWRSGLPLQVESPSLMTGLAGIGYGLLRMARPQQLPSVLLLEPPLG
jgi:type 2 lantibiotic biosynthesis protein LanM